MRKVILGLALLLSACNMEQDALDDAKMICKDGVQYMTFWKINTSGSASFSVVPHFKPDGSLYTCKEIKRV